MPGAEGSNKRHVHWQSWRGHKCTRIRHGLIEQRTSDWMHSGAPALCMGAGGASAPKSNTGALAIGRKAGPCNVIGA